MPVPFAYGHVSPQAENCHQVFKDPDGPLQCEMSCIMWSQKWISLLHYWMLIPRCCNDLSERCSENTKSSCLNAKVSLHLAFWLGYHGSDIFACNVGFCLPAPSGWLAPPLPWPACPPQPRAARPPAPITAETPSAASWLSHRSSNKWLFPTSTSPRSSWELMNSGRRQRSWHVKAAVKLTINPF